MSIKEAYAEFGGDYEGVLSRLASDALVERFAIKFLADDSFPNLKQYLAEGNEQEAFRAAHTLKGVCQNLGFDNLYAPAFELTELLRTGSMDGYAPLFAEVEKEYERTVEVLKAAQ